MIGVLMKKIVNLFNKKMIKFIIIIKNNLKKVNNNGDIKSI